MGREQELEALLGWIFDQMREGLRDDVGPGDYERLKRDFVFHMTDWDSDLKGIASFFETPGAIPKKQAAQLVVGFLYHVIPHLKAAGRLLLDDVGDPFADEEVFGLLEKTAYWGVVEDCLVRFHELTEPSAQGKANQYRGQIADQSSGAVSDPVGRREPFQVACELAGVKSADEQDRLFSLHAEEYQSICRFRGWRPACVAGR